MGKKKRLFVSIGGVQGGPFKNKPGGKWNRGGTPCSFGARPGKKESFEKKEKKNLGVAKRTKI